MSESRGQILHDVQRNAPPVAPLPDREGDWIRYDAPREQFMSVLETVGGEAIVVADHEQLQARIAELPLCAEGGKVVSLLPGVGRSDIDPQQIAEPRDLADVDLAILPAHFGVAENAALWITDDDVPHRALYYICRHLILVVGANELVHNMHEAYDRLAAERSGAGPFAEPGFGCFISGPSKTADIEQSLVIGAQGARSLTVFLVENG